MSDPKKTFTYKDTKGVEHTVSFAKGDFSLNQLNTKLYDEKMKSKPTTFLKDALKRFAKNKSSVAGAIILGSLLLLSFILPVALPSSLDTTDVNLAKQTFLAPKLFESGTGWWDGCRAYKNITMDFDWEAYEKDGTYSGNPAGEFSSEYIVGEPKISRVGEQKINVYSPYARGGYIRLTTSSQKGAELDSYPTTFRFSDYDYHLSLEVAELPADFTFGTMSPYTISFAYWDHNLSEGDEGYVLYKTALAADETEPKSYDFALSENEEILANTASMSAGADGYLSVELPGDSNAYHSVLLRNLIFSSADAPEAVQKELSNVSAKDANYALGINPTSKDGVKPKYYWRSPRGTKEVYAADIVTISFRYDTYEAAFGDVWTTGIPKTDMKNYVRQGWITCNSIEEFEASKMTDEQIAVFEQSFAMTPEGEKHCPLHIDEEHPIKVSVVKAGKKKAMEFAGYVTRYKLYGYSKMPKFLFGTDVLGRDIVKLVFRGLRTSILLGVIVSAVNLIIGLVWGAISGYFGGTTDIVMERFCEILGGIPWVVVMTLAIVNFSDKMPLIVLLGLAMCATGWLGTAGLTRTQFYRFKDREYILAARTLGARDGRLIFRHILPNAIGTIVTSSVLMIPSVIFSEASLSYLGLIKGLSSFGVTLSDNQIYLPVYPNLILFPSVIMALIMISFNLFGNGLRDALNPSLKGSD